MFSRTPGIYRDFFFFMLDFLKFEYDMLGVVFVFLGFSFFNVFMVFSFCFSLLLLLFVCFHVFCLFSELPGSVVWYLDINLVKSSVIIASHIASVPFSVSSLLVFSLHVIYTFCSCSTVVGDPVLFSSVFFFFLCFSSFEVTVIISSSSEILSSVVSSLVMSPPSFSLQCV